MTSHQLARLLLQNPDVVVKSAVPHEGFWVEVLGITYEDGEATLEIEEDLPGCTYPEKKEIASVMAADSITCPLCQMKSYNPNDIREKYCGNCHAFWEVQVEAERYATELAERAKAKDL